MILRFKRKRLKALSTSLEIFAHILVSSSFVDEEVSQRKLSSASRSKVALSVKLCTSGKDLQPTAGTMHLRGREGLDKFCHVTDNEFYTVVFASKIL